MNRIIQSVLLSVLTISAAQATMHSNRTHLRMRDSLSYNHAMNTFGQARMPHGAASKFGAVVSVAGYYRASHNQSDMATYFGGGQEVNKDQNGTIVVGSTAANAQTAEGRSDIMSGTTMFHKDDASVLASGTITLAPTYKEYGAHINVGKDLSQVLKGLYLSADLPITHVETSMGATTSNSNITNHLQGLYTAAGADKQVALSHARMDNVKRTKTGLADLGLHLTYRLRNQKADKLHVGLDFTIPTGNKTDAVNLYNPQVGNGKHFGLGASAHYLYRIWHTNPCTQGLDLIANANYRYLFSADQTRTMGVYNHQFDRLQTAGHYRNLVKAGDKQATPGANTLTRLMSVTPGSEFSGILGLKYHYKNFNLFASYNLYARDKEEAKLKTSSQWFDSEYAAPDNGHAMTTAVVAGDNNVTIDSFIQKEGNVTAATLASDGGAIGSENNAAYYYVTTDACQSPSDVTHMVSGAAEMQFTKFKFPFSITAGGNYEFTGRKDNRGAHCWSAWTKLSACF